MTKTLISEEVRLNIGWIMVAFIITWATIIIIYMILDVKQNAYGIYIQIIEIKKLLFSDKSRDEAEGLLGSKMKKKFKRRSAIKEANQ